MKCDELKRFNIVGKYSDEETMYEFRPDGECYDADEVDAAIAELKAKLEDAKSTAYAESVDAGMRERRLKRSLWLDRAERARAMKAIENLDNYLSLHKNSKWFGIYATRIDTWYYKWDNLERKCLKKAEEYR